MSGAREPVGRARACGLEAPREFEARQVSASIRDNRETRIVLQFSEGEQCVRFWTSDLTVDYVNFNADYHT